MEFASRCIVRENVSDESVSQLISLSTLDLSFMGVTTFGLRGTYQLVLFAEAKTRNAKEMCFLLGTNRSTVLPGKKEPIVLDSLYEILNLPTENQELGKVIVPVNAT